MAIVGIFVSKLADYLVEKQVFFEAEQSESKMHSTIDMNEIKYKFYTDTNEIKIRFTRLLYL